jgi:ATP-dependent helicase/DNAse subunit B
VPKIVVYLGPARCGKTHELLPPYRAALRLENPAGSGSSAARAKGRLRPVTLWLTPNFRTAEAIRARLLGDGLDACFWPGVLTFDQLSEQILAATPTRPRWITPLQQRELLQRIVHQALSESKLVRFAASAQRSGFIDVLAAHVQELQRRAISPAVYGRALPPHRDQQQHRELAHLYGQYVRLLAEHNLVDIDGAHLAASAALAAGNADLFQALELVVVDGFTDFTRSQHDLLHRIGDRTQELLISLPDDSPDADGRADLFAKVRATLGELRRRHPQLEVRRLPPRALAWPAADYVAANIFRRPAQVPALSAAALQSLDRLEIVEAAGAQDEIVEIARRIKRLLTEREVKPGEIVVVFRSLAEAAPRVREAFDRFGIPYHLDSRPPLGTAPLVKTLVALLRLHDEDWPFRRLVSLVTNNTLTALEDSARQATDWLVRDLQIAQGRAALLQRVDQLEAEAASPNQSEYAQRRSDAAKRAKPLLAQFAIVLKGLPDQATPSEWAGALMRAGADLGLPPFTNEPAAAEDMAAWLAIEQHFAALASLDAWMGQAPAIWSRRELIRQLLDLAAHQLLPALHDDVGRVRILSAPATRNLSARHFFLAGMSEQAFPSPESLGRLATEADYRHAAAVADQFSPATQVDFASRSQDEMLLFYEVLSRAHESLTISYPALDDKAQCLPPSPYLLEIQRMLGEQGMKHVRRSTPNLSPLPYMASARGADGQISERLTRASDIFSLADWRVQAVADALAGDGRLLAALFSSAARAIDETDAASLTALAEAIDAGIRVIHARTGESFGPAEGMLASPAVASRLAQRFGPQHLWSPSQWETYAACPFKFFLQGVLGLEPLGDLVLETDFARRGSRLHHVLATFHRQWAALGRSILSEEQAAEFLDRLHQVIDERMAGTPGAGIDAALTELDCRQIRNWAAKHFDHHREYHGACSQFGGPMTPRHFEFRFGPPRPGSNADDPASTNDPFLLELGGEQIRVTGQIDRIDVAAIDGKTCFTVIDYKSGKKTALKYAHIESGERLQLPIYVEAAQTLLFGGTATALAAGYWSIGSGFDSKSDLAFLSEAENAERWKNVQSTVHRVVGQCVAAIRRGEFPVASRDDDCTSYCEFNTVCRVAQIRSLKKIRNAEPAGDAPPAQASRNAKNRG